MHALEIMIVKNLLCIRNTWWQNVYSPHITTGWLDVKHWVDVLLYIHRNHRFIRDGSPEWPPGLSHSSWALVKHQLTYFLLLLILLCIYIYNIYTHVLLNQSSLVKNTLASKSETKFNVKRPKLKALACSCFPVFLSYWSEHFPWYAPLSQLEVKAWEVIHHWKPISMTGLFPSNYGQRPCNSRQNSFNTKWKENEEKSTTIKSKIFLCVCVCVCVLLHQCTPEAVKCNSTKNVCVAISSNLATASSFHTVRIFLQSWFLRQSY